MHRDSQIQLQISQDNARHLRDWLIHKLERHVMSFSFQITSLAHLQHGGFYRMPNLLVFAKLKIAAPKFFPLCYRKAIHTAVFSAKS